MPRLSIILPFYNSEKTIERALLSILNQTFTNFECILIDNNSTDRSREIILQTIRDDKRFILTEESRQGVVFASNKGSELAKGEYIARMDSDDECLEKRFELQLLFLDENKEFGAVAGMVEFVGNEDKNLGFSRYVDWVNSVDSYDKILIKQFVESPIVNPSAMWRRETAEKHGMYRNAEFPEDYELWLRWLEAKVKIGKIQEKVLKWYDSDNRLTRTDQRYCNEAFYKVKSPFLARYLKEINPHFPKVTVWGASRISRQRAKLLVEFGVEISGFIDISKKRKLSEKLIFYKDIPERGSMFILVYVRQEKMRNQVQDYLENRGYKEGVDYLLGS